MRRRNPTPRPQRAGECGSPTARTEPPADAFRASAEARDWRDIDDDSDPYGDVPASLELAYTPADIGLSPNAYERAFPYGSRRSRARGARARRVGRELVETVILALLIFFSVKAVVQNFRVEG